MTQPTPRPRSQRPFGSAHAACLTACVLAALLATGCTSDNTHEFQSRIYQPITITLSDPARQTELWTYDIPTQHMLVLDYNRELQSGWGNEMELFRVKDIPPTHVKWRLYRGFGKDIDRQIAKCRLELPGSPVKMEMTIRPTPEFPPDTTPTAPPATLEPRPMGEDNEDPSYSDPTPQQAYDEASPAPIEPGEPDMPDATRDEPAADADQAADAEPTTQPTTQPE